MYNPKGNGKEKTVPSVQFTEAEPPDHLSRVVHRFLELKTDGVLPDDYRFHALPDACTYIVFDQVNPNTTGITGLRAASEELNLGKAFHYVNIRFLPGVWHGLEQVAHGLVNAPYLGELPLIKTNRALVGVDFAAKQTVLSELVDWLVAKKWVAANPVLEKILAHIADVHAVTDMAEIVGVSPRQLQRVFKTTTGFSPHNFLKVLRLQQSLGGDPSLSYADQSHFIHSFRKATGYTPTKYARKFDV